MHIIKKYLAVSLILFISNLFSEVPPDFNPHAIYLTWQQDPTKTMTIQWISNQDSADDEIEYKKHEDIAAADTSKNPLNDAWNLASGTHHNLPEKCPHFVHVVELTNLLPNTVYTFRIGKSDKTYLFKTMPQDPIEPITFIVGGDTYQRQKQWFVETNKQAALQEPSFVLLGGDLAYAAPDKSGTPEDAERWLIWLKEWSDTMRTPKGYLIPLLVTIGNHEVKGRYSRTPDDALFFYALFATPGLQGYKALHFSSYLSLILLDSGHTHPIAGKQTEWLENELSKERNFLHRFAIYHVPAYPSVRGFRQPYSSLIRRHWLPLFEKYGVQVVFENHDHAYKRTYPLINGNVHPYGIVYLGDGSWGVKPRIPKKAQNSPYLAKTASSRQFIKVTLSKEEREFWSIADDGQIIDHYIQNVHRPKVKYLTRKASAE
jgi:acid phosphatase type 7